LGAPMNLKLTSSIATGLIQSGTSRRGDSQKSSARNMGRRPDACITTIPPGGFMTEQLGQDLFSQPSPRGVVPAQDSTNTSASEWRHLKWHQEQEREWQCRLSDLRQCICELLIKNQQLRQSLTTATQPGKESAHEYSQKIASDQS
jgi:hypothetical protein